LSFSASSPVSQHLAHSWSHFRFLLPAGLVYFPFPERAFSFRPHLATFSLVASKYRDDGHESRRRASKCRATRSGQIILLSDSRTLQTAGQAILRQDIAASAAAATTRASPSRRRKPAPQSSAAAAFRPRRRNPLPQSSAAPFAPAPAKTLRLIICQWHRLSPLSSAVAWAAGTTPLLPVPMRPLVSGGRSPFIFRLLCLSSFQITTFLLEWITWLRSCSGFHPPRRNISTPDAGRGRRLKSPMHEIAGGVVAGWLCRGPYGDSAVLGLKGWAERHRLCPCSGRR